MNTCFWMSLDCVEYNMSVLWFIHHRVFCLNLSRLLLTEMCVPYQLNIHLFKMLIFSSEVLVSILNKANQALVRVGEVVKCGETNPPSGVNVKQM
jgi:hypothetical protein